MYYLFHPALTVQRLSLRPVSAAALVLSILLWPAGPALSAAKLTGRQVEEGRYLASMCTTCHQPGQKHAGIPRITGYSAKEMMEMMMEYRGGIEHHGAMENIAQSLTDAELVILSAYLATTNPAAPKSAKQHVKGPIK